MTQLQRTLETMLQCEQDNQLVNNQAHQSGTQTEVSEDAEHNGSNIKPYIR